MALEKPSIPIWFAPSSFLGSRGGICDKEADFQEKQEQVSYNTGLVGFTHNYIRVPDLISKFTFAHELGHSFGSQVW